MNSAALKRRLGQVETTELKGHELKLPGGNVAKRFLYNWRPPNHVASRLPSWHRLALECTVAPNGLRRFAPIELSRIDRELRETGFQHIATTRGLALCTSLGGGAILARNRIKRPGQLVSYHEARLLLQYIQHRREYFGGTRPLALATRVCKAGRSDRSAKDILPEDLGKDRDGSGPSWSFGDVRREGLRAAQSANISNPSPEQIFRLGMMKAAKLNPIQADEAVAEGFVRLAMFNLGSTSEPVEPDQLEYVAQQAGLSLCDHLDDSPEQFRRWIVDSGSNLPRRISKRKSCEMSREHVRKCLLELGWQSFKIVAACVDAQMCAFRDALRDKLTPQENAWFELLYLANPTFGGIPMILFVDRFDFLRESILDLWKRPNDSEAADVLRTMMHYYAVLAGNRRDADRLYKQRGRNTRHGAVREESPVSNDFVCANATFEPKLFAEISLRIAQKKGYRCDFGFSEYQATLERPEGNSISFRLICLDCKFDKVIEVNQLDFEAAALEVGKEHEEG